MDMHHYEGKNLLTTFLFTFFFIAVASFIVYGIGGYEAAVLVALSLVGALIATTAVGTENTIGNQLEIFRGEMKGYLLDMYAEMIKKDN